MLNEHQHQRAATAESHPDARDELAEIAREAVDCILHARAAKDKARRLHQRVEPWVHFWSALPLPETEALVEGLATGRYAWGVEAPAVIDVCVYDEQGQHTATIPVEVSLHDACGLLEDHAGDFDGHVMPRPVGGRHAA